MLLEELQWDSTAMELSRRIGPETVLLEACQDRSIPAGQLRHWEHCYFDRNLKYLSKYFHSFHTWVIFSDVLSVYPLLELRYQNKVSSLSCNAKHREKKKKKKTNYHSRSCLVSLTLGILITCCFPEKKMTDGTKPNNMHKRSARVVALSP